MEMLFDVVKWAGLVLGGLVLLAVVVTEASLFGVMIVVSVKGIMANMKANNQTSGVD